MSTSAEGTTSATSFDLKPHQHSLKAASMAAAGMYWPTTFDSSYYSTSTALAAAGAAMTAVSTSGISGCNSMADGIAAAAASPFGAYSGSSTGSSSAASLLSGMTGVTRSFAHSTTPTTPKKKANPVPHHMKDETYWDRRKKNNESARRSRESRRMKEEQVAFRVVYLEQENIQLRTECQMLKLQIEKLTMLLYGSTNQR